VKGEKKDWMDKEVGKRKEGKMELLQKACPKSIKKKKRMNNTHFRYAQTGAPRSRGEDKR
jgi:hypothetical protein